jgi:tRNA (cytidine/uridine-2'-O-)-methyltransferase
MTDARMKIVLVEPEIPHNTGSIGRTCVALDIELILIKPYGFNIDAKTVQRAGTRYWQFVQLTEYDSWQDFIAARAPREDQLYLFEEHGAQSFYEPDYVPDAYLVFGRESTGLPQYVLDAHNERIFNVPMRNDKVKSLNLSNVATAVIYQAMRAYLIA